MFFSKAWQETRGNIFATGNVCLLKNIPTFESSSGVLVLFYFQRQRGRHINPNWEKKMPHCNSPLGSRNKRITYACIMENFLPQTRQKTSLFFTRHLKLCASQYQKTGRAIFSIKPLDGVSKKLALVKRYGQDSEDPIP